MSRMNEYKVCQVVVLTEGERLMNEMAKDGWTVASTAATGNRLIITFERDAQ